MTTPETIPKQNSSSNIIIPSILSVLIVLMGITLLYVYLDTQAKNQSIRNLLHRVTKLQSITQTNINKEHLATVNALDIQSQAIRQLENKITLNAQEKVSEPSDDTFTVNKAHALLDLAQTNAYWTDDTRTTVALLDQADTLLAQTKNPKMLPIRAAIARERTHQLNVQHVDVIRILSQLAADQTLINTLPLKQIDPNPSIKPGVTNAVQSAWEKLQSLIILSHHDAATPVTLTFTDAIYMRAALSLDFENAQWAVLHNQPAIFILSLKDAVRILNRGFDQHASAQLKKHLIELQQQTINIKTPITQDFSLGESA